MSTLTRRRTRKTDPLLFRLALHIVKDLRKQDAEHEEECQEWARQGRRPHYCRHGMDRWVDYDNICGACEDPRSNYSIALDEASGILAEYERRTAIARPVYMDPSVPEKAATSLREWAFQPIDRALS